MATGNPHKVAELRQLLAPALHEYGFSLIGLSDLSRPTVEPAETGHTFEANAAIKASSYAKQTGHICLADDSGLEIDALQGRPGVISSHYANDGVETGLSREQRDIANLQRVLRELGAVPELDRTARFVCVMTLASPDGTILGSVRGTCEGRIGSPPHVPRGTNGFGYDPIFLVSPEHQKTSAELSADDKNAISHRGAAAQHMVQLLAHLQAS